MRDRTLLLALLPISLLIGCGDLSGDNDIKTSKYASFIEASETGAFEAGWLPQALPQSAANIVEAHNIDSGEMWITFRYSDNDIHGLIQGCIADRKVQFPNAERTKRDAAWWPSDLTAGSDEQLHKRWIILSCPGMRHAGGIYSMNVAVDAKKRTTWYWRSF